MKQDEILLSKYRNISKPFIHEITSMYDRVFTKLEPEAAAFNLPVFIEQFESTCFGMMDASKLVKEKYVALMQPYLKL
jgi:hypothetical protein